MNKQIKITEITNHNELPSNLDTIIEIKNGEINVMSTNPPKNFLIINEDENKIIMKSIKDPFMAFSLVVKDRLEKWKKNQKT